VWIQDVGSIYKWALILLHTMNTYLYKVITSHLCGYQENVDLKWVIILSVCMYYNVSILDNSMYTPFYVVVFF